MKREAEKKGKRKELY